MSRHSFAGVIALILSSAPAFAAGPLSVTTAMMVERHVAAPDGTTRTTLSPAAKVVPGDVVVVVVTYRNTGPAPIADLVLANPVPRATAYRGPASGSPAPEVSVDGKTFGTLASLRVAVPGGGTRAAVPADVTSVRWRLSSPLAAGSSGERAFQAVLK